MTSYTVQKGDTLGTIAAKFLGSSSRYKEIASANPQITNINVISPGQKLTIPSGNLPAIVPQTSAPSSSLVFDQPTDSLMSKLLANKKLMVLLALGVGVIIYVKTKTRRAVA